ncbi:hypothetical protein TNCV_2733271 [Trichonephila clavipes]|nr:hypothetical protein TNCV_2733271 [Trichonephila clavipes]
MFKDNPEKCIAVSAFLPKRPKEYLLTPHHKARRELLAKYLESFNLGNADVIAVDPTSTEENMIFQCLKKWKNRESQLTPSESMQIDCLVTYPRRKAERETNIQTSASQVMYTRYDNYIPGLHMPQRLGLEWEWNVVDHDLSVAGGPLFHPSISVIAKHFDLRDQ